MNLKHIAAAVAAACALGAAGSASAFTMTFEGLQNNEAILSYYAGGAGGNGSTGGPNFGVTWGSSALALIDADAGGGGNFANEPTPNTIMYFLQGNAILNYAAGFDTGFSFYYTTSQAGVVNVYDDLNGTGNLLGTIALSRNIDGCQGDPGGSFCRFDIGAVAFAGIAKSIDFGGAANQIGYDNITFGSTNPTVPEPGTLALLGLGAMGLAALRRRRA